MTSLTCNICPRGCELREGGPPGFCQIRANINGKNVDAISGIVTLLTMRWLLADGKQVLAFGPVFPGCNLKCFSCLVPQSWNWQSLSDTQMPGLMHVSTTEIVGSAICKGATILCTGGGEPSIHHEFLLDLFQLCRTVQLTSQISTNGYTEPWLSEALSKAVDFPAVAFKASASPTFYEKTDAHPRTVLESARIFHTNNPKTEITNLVGPTLNISNEDHRKFAIWIRDNLSPDAPLQLKYALNPRDPPWLSSEFERSHELAFYEAASKYLLETASLLADGGLTNIFWNDPLDIHDGKVQWVHVGK
jgi:pyruvate-formate lyase-activating enzyme